MSAGEKDLEILLLRQQLMILERKMKGPARVTRAEKLTLAVITNKPRNTTQSTVKDLRGVMRIFQPKTVIGWHGELVRRKWTYRRKQRGGRPRIAPEVEQLIVQLARENEWGYSKIAGELRKLGYKASKPTIANVLARHGIVPAPQRDNSPSCQLAAADDPLPRADPRL